MLVALFAGEPADFASTDKPNPNETKASEIPSSLFISMPPKTKIGRTLPASAGEFDLILKTPATLVWLRKTSTTQEKQ